MIHTENLFIPYISTYISRLSNAKNWNYNILDHVQDFKSTR
jgi:hypothetical protein